MRHRRAPGLWIVAFACAAMPAVACSPKLVGRCATADCAAAGCEISEQHLPANCDADAGTCGGVVIDDVRACRDCMDTRRRLNIGNAENEAHLQCACRFCSLQITACVDSVRDDDGDAARDEHCRAIIECSLAAGCSGTECYCGAAVDQITCLAAANDGGTNGPCERTILAAGNCLDDPRPGDCVLNQRFDLRTAIGRAVAVGTCTTGDPVVGREGRCPFETPADR